jgi:hypothetical protein
VSASAVVDHLEEAGLSLEELIYARILNPTSLRDAWARYDRGDFMLGLAWHLGVPLDGPTIVRFAIECTDRALVPIGHLDYPYSRLVTGLQRWASGQGWTSLYAGIEFPAVEAGLLELLPLAQRNNRGPIPAVTALTATYLSAVYLKVGPLPALAMVRLAAIFSVSAALDMPGEQRWQAARLRELIRGSDLPGEGWQANPLRELLIRA